MTGLRTKVPVAALVLPPMAVLALYVAWAFTAENATTIVTIAIWAVVLGVVVEGFAIPIAVTALGRNGSSRTIANILATIIGISSLIFGTILLVALSRGM